MLHGRDNENIFHGKKQFFPIGKNLSFLPCDIHSLLPIGYQLGHFNAMKIENYIRFLQTDYWRRLGREKWNLAHSELSWPNELRKTNKQTNRQQQLTTTCNITLHKENRGHCIVFSDETLNSHNVYLHPGEWVNGYRRIKWWKVTQRLTRNPSRGEYKHSLSLHATGTGVNFGLVGYSARMQTLPFKPLQGNLYLCKPFPWGKERVIPSGQDLRARARW